jgi:hypothetical protein
MSAARTKLSASTSGAAVFSFLEHENKQKDKINNKVQYMLFGGKVFI